MADVATLPKLYTEAEAAEELGVSVATLRRERKRRRIGFKRIGQRKVKYTDAHLAEYLERQDVEPCPDETSGSGKSADTGSPARPSPPTGKSPGSTPTPDSGEAAALARQIFARPK